MKIIRHELHANNFENYFQSNFPKFTKNFKLNLDKSKEKSIDIMISNL